MKTLNKNTLSVKEFDNGLIVTIKNTDRLNILNSAEVEKELTELVLSENRTILLNFDDILFIDSSGFQALLSVHIDAKLNNSRLVLINVNDEINELFRLVDLDNIFEIETKNEFQATDLKQAS